MKVPAAWVRSLLRRTISNEEIINALESAGIEIEQISSSKGFDKNIVIGLVTKVVQHPEADRLRIANVQTSDAELSIVCGAPNVRVGLLAAVAQIGSILPDGTKIAAAKLRGQKSEGMLCSGRELGLSDDHDGLMEFSDEIAPGTALCDIHPAEVIIDLKTAANRPDLQSMVGLAREVAAFSANELIELAPPAAAPPNDAVAQKTTVRIAMDAPAAQAPRFMLAELDLTALDPKRLPSEMTAWLAASGVRSLLPAVDVTNFVMLEYGQPLHAYDADQITLPLGVRAARDGETLTTLDGVVRTLSADDLVVADANGPVGLAGVMGGADSQVTAGTKRIYLEAASFDGAIIRQAARRHNLRSEASARYERGLPVQAAPYGLARAAALLMAAGAQSIGNVADELRVWPWIQRIGLPVARVDQVAGYRVGRDGAVAALARLGIEARSFDIVAEARRHMGKPYVWGASYKKTGTAGFDCSYLTDYLYSLIGKRIGYTSLAQFEIGQPVETGNLEPGDILFIEGKPEEDAGNYGIDDVASGKQPHSLKGYYFLWDEATGRYVRHESTSGQNVGHDGLYIGDGKVIQASRYEYVDGVWRERTTTGVIESDVHEFLDNPGYLGARRFVADMADYVSVEAIPWWRTDLKIAEDLIEEIVRVRGYAQVPSRLPDWHPQAVTFDRAPSQDRVVKDLLSGSGLFEIMTYSFTGDEQLAAAGQSPERLVRLENPMSSEQTYLRASLIPSQLEVAARNRGYKAEYGFYELGRVYVKSVDGGLPREPRRLSVTIVRPADSYRVAKGVLDQLAWLMGLELEVKPVAAVTAPYAAGRTGTIKLGGRKIGTIGQLDPSVVRGLKLAGEVTCLELDYEPLAAAAQPRTYEPLRRFPGITRDLTLRVAPDVTYAAVRAAIADDRKLAQSRLQALIDYVADFTPPGATYKHLTIRLGLSLPDRTLGDAEADDYETRVRHVLAKAVAAEF